MRLRLSLFGVLARVVVSPCLFLLFLVFFFFFPRGPPRFVGSFSLISPLWFFVEFLCFVPPSIFSAPPQLIRSPTVLFFFLSFRCTASVGFVLATGRFLV